MMEYLFIRVLTLDTEEVTRTLNRHAEADWQIVCFDVDSNGWAVALFERHRREVDEDDYNTNRPTGMHGGIEGEG